MLNMAASVSGSTYLLCLLLLFTLMPPAKYFSCCKPHWFWYAWFWYNNLYTLICKGALRWKRCDIWYMLCFDSIKGNVVKVVL